MPLFKLFWDEAYSFEALVEAKDLEEAKRKLKMSPSDYSNPGEGSYIDGSLNINHELCEEMNDINGVKKQ